MNNTLGPLIIGLKIEIGGAVRDGIVSGPGLLYKNLEDALTPLSYLTMGIPK